MTSDPDDAAPGQLRALSRNTVTASLSAVGALLLATDPHTWWESLVLVAGLVAALFAVSRWSKDRITRVTLPCLAITVGVWLFGVLVADAPEASYGLAIVGSVLFYRLPRRGRAAALGLTALVLAGIAARPLVADGGVLGDLVRFAVAALSVAAVAVVLTSLNQMLSGLIAQLERSREREAELAVARERVRFAGDLHDIQGHTLHVVKLKTALARKLVRADADRAEEELGEIHALVGDTIVQTRELAYAQRRLNLSAELENAKNLFEAAGITVRVEREGEVDAHAGELLGQVLRETTTNILRHAQAEQVRISLSETGISIVNDGVPDAPPPHLGGLSTLRERVEGEGGELTVEQGDGRFLTAAAFPRRALRRVP
jgi:two-component system sensor histidine kinase DesK